jgi:hypothetical protein
MTGLLSPLGAFAVLALGTTLLLGGPREVSAKGNSWIITGGELGEQAVHVGFWRFEDDVQDPPGRDVVRVDAPTVAPAGGYEFYRYATVGQVADDVRAGAAEFVFYDESGLLYDRREYAGSDGQWFRVPEDGVARRYVEYAVSRIGTEDAQPSPLVAAATAYGWLGRSDASFRVVVPRWSDHAVNGTPGALTDDNAQALGRDMVDALAVPPAGRGGTSEVVWLLLVTYNWSGPVGFYAPPDPRAGLTGRFWPQAYPQELLPDAPYYTTTPRFDALVQQSIEAGAAHELERQRHAEESRARIRAANEERMARVAREQREAQLALFRAVEPLPAGPIAGETSAASGVRTTVGSLAVALLIAVLGVALVRQRAARR